MARSKKDELIIEEEITSSNEEIAEKESANPIKEADVAEVSVVSTEPKKVKIRTVEDINCIVAGVPYSYKADKEVQVPSDVGAILINSRKAFKI